MVIKSIKGIWRKSTASCHKLSPFFCNDFNKVKIYQSIPVPKIS